MSDIAAPPATPAPAAAAPASTAPEAPAPAAQVPAVAPAAKPAASIATHPMAIWPSEGLLLVPVEDAIKLLNTVLKLKYTAILMYMNYGDRLLAHFRDAIYAHFNEHIEDERKAAYELTRKITAWGGAPIPAVVKVPSVDELHQMLTQIMMAESDLLDAERAVLKITGENVALRVFIEGMMEIDNHHLDDMRRMLLCEA
jgi:bacterioferritin